MDVIPAQSELFHDSGAVVFNHYVRAFDQLAGKGRAFGAAQVDFHTLLVPCADLEPEPTRALWAHLPEAVALVRALNLYNLGTVIAQQACCEGPCNHVSEFKYPDSF